MSSATIKTLPFLYCLLWTCTRQSSQCFFLFNSVSRAAKSTQFSTQPITFQVPKKDVDDLKTMLEKNPEYLKKLVAQSRSPNSPIPVVTKSLTNQLDTGIPMSSSVFNNVPILIPESSALLPDEIVYNGRKWKKTTRGNMLMNNGLGYLKRGFSTLTESLPQPSLHNISVTYPQKTNEPGKWKKIEIIKNGGDGDAEKVHEYTSSGENDDDDRSDGDSADENGGASDSADDGSYDDEVEDGVEKSD